MNDDVLCNFCTLYVKCKNNEHSFCLVEDLFTHTEKTDCDNYNFGEPMTEEEFDNV